MNYFYLVLLAVIIVIAIIVAIKQPAKIKEWLIWAVTQAEKDLGSGTGQMKLRKVYDMFTSKYKFISMFVTFDIFSKWVDSALDIMREMINTNPNIESYVCLYTLSGRKEV